MSDFVRKASSESGEIQISDGMVVELNPRYSYTVTLSGDLGGASAVTLQREVGEEWEDYEESDGTDSQEFVLWLTPEGRVKFVVTGEDEDTELLFVFARHAFDAAEAESVLRALEGMDATQEAASRAALGVGVVAYDDFTRHAEGAEIAHESSPLFGPDYFVKIDGTAPERNPIVNCGGLVPQGGTLLYLGGDFGETIKRIDFDLTVHAIGGATRNWWAMAFSAVPILNESGDWDELPEGMMHIELDPAGIFKFGIGEGGASFRQISPNRGIAAGGIWPWNPGMLVGGACDYGRPWRLTLEFEGTTCRITAFGHTYEFTDPEIALPQHWYWECYGNEPVTYREFISLHRWAASRDYSEPFPNLMASRLGDLACNGKLTIKQQQTLLGAERVTHQVLTLSGNLSNNDTVTIGDRTYTAKSTSPAANQFLIGGSASATIDNLVSAINLGDGAGTTYGSGTALHAKARAVQGPGDTLYAYAKDVHDTSVVTTKSAANATWGAGTMEYKVPLANWNTGNLEDFDGIAVNGDMAISGDLRVTPAVNVGPFNPAYVTSTHGVPTLSNGTSSQELSLLSGGLLLAAGDTEDIQWTGVFGGNGNNKRIIVNVTGGSFWDSGDLNNNGEAWVLKITRYRAGTGTQQTIQLQLTFETATTKIMPPAVAINTAYEGVVSYQLLVTTVAPNDIIVGSGRCISYVK